MKQMLKSEGKKLSGSKAGSGPVTIQSRVNKFSSNFTELVARLVEDSAEGKSRNGGKNKRDNTLSKEGQKRRKF